VLSYDGSQKAPQASAGLPPPAPEMPTMAPADLYVGTPNLLLASGIRHSLGWQDDRKAGPSFVVVRLSRLDNIKVMQRFPLTEQGWATAWQTLAGLDAEAAVAVAARLARREAGRRGAAALNALDAESLCCLRYAIFNGGSGTAPLAKGQAYDLRFLSDRIMISPRRSAEALVEVQYRDVETVEVSQSSPGRAPAEIAVLILAVGLLGALLGLFILGLVGALFGALIFAAVAAMIGAVSGKIETLLRLRGPDVEFYFVITEKRADALRIALSEPLRVIETARAAQVSETQPGDSDGPAAVAPGTIPDQLTKLASLLQQGLITRHEFEHLKAKLIADS
jgi:hypothetical protein